MSNVAAPAKNALEAEAVNASATYTWTIELFELRGHCNIRWSTNAPFRAQQGRVCLYAGSFPANPEEATAWRFDDLQQPFDTGQLWGAGWCAAYIAQASPNGPYIYLAKTKST